MDFQILGHKFHTVAQTLAQTAIRQDVLHAHQRHFEFLSINHVIVRVILFKPKVQQYARVNTANICT
jgi:hypothetical protein